ncbi:MAG: 3-deoxy-manno-octulosonate cytidylyltransferase [Rhodospirillales bacterium]|nr:3-deoxy-manno-octulosonate cytidylyltransferase [Rhodospirillales bacterium]
MKKIGIVPARMAASRFPGKPLKNILGRPMLEHVFERARLNDSLDALVIATCDQEIREFAETKGYPVVMTSDRHTRALDRVAEAATLCDENISDHDLVLCIQGDEPMMQPDMITTVLEPLYRDDREGTILAMDIVDEDVFLNPDTVKIIHDITGKVLYTSRSPVPHCKSFSQELGAKRIYGIFGFKWRLLNWFTELPESPLELAEACDSNRICDNGRYQHIAHYPYIPSYSVDSASDLLKVEQAMNNDALWGKY